MTCNQLILIQDDREKHSDFLLWYVLRDHLESDSWNRALVFSRKRNTPFLPLKTSHAILDTCLDEEILRKQGHSLFNSLVERTWSSFVGIADLSELISAGWLDESNVDTLKTQMQFGLTLALNLPHHSDVSESAKIARSIAEDLQATVENVNVPVVWKKLG